MYIDFDNLTFWHWFILAGLLMVLEIVSPGFFLIWIGISAAIVGLLMLIFPLGLPLQITLFAVFSILSVVLCRFVAKRRPPVEPDVVLNRRGESYVGQVFLLDSPLRQGRGRLRIGDSVWNIQGPDLDPGQRVKIVGIHSTTLEVEPIEEK